MIFLTELTSAASLSLAPLGVRGSRMIRNEDISFHVPKSI
jgi:hypothetical protein